MSDDVMISMEESLVRFHMLPTGWSIDIIAFSDYTAFYEIFYFEVHDCCVKYLDV